MRNGYDKSNIFLSTRQVEKCKSNSAYRCNLERIRRTAMVKIMTQTGYKQHKAFQIPKGNIGLEHLLNTKIANYLIHAEQRYYKVF